MNTTILRKLFQMSLFATSLTVFSGLAFAKDDKPAKGEMMDKKKMMPSEAPKGEMMDKPAMPKKMMPDSWAKMNMESGEMPTAPEGMDANKMPMYEVCVNPDGTVNSVTAMKNAMMDDAAKSAMEAQMMAWKFKAQKDMMMLSCFKFTPMKAKPAMKNK